MAQVDPRGSDAVPNARDRMVERMRSVCDFIEARADRPPSLAELGRRFHMSPGWLQRRFRAIVGVTPKRYAEACRLRCLRRALREGDSVTSAIVDAGFGSTSRVYEQGDARMGMTPGEYRAGGAGLTIAYATAETPLGHLLMAATERGLCSVRLGDDPAGLVEQLRAEFADAELEAMPARADGAFGEWMEALRAYLDGACVAPALPTDIRGTAFRMMIWDYLRRIPAGETRSYAQVAAGVARPDAVRAVAGACAANPVALAIPCHRVIRGDGGLGGYRWGIERKRALLALERGEGT